ncbi:hypothetical protein I858_016255 [Planococcus versutus]|uniref:TVP38/TMEM64 family membrane protein n=1 Tax=Planococcus versutus TaxID=1302659 RepID=A0A1B1S5S4_9BACL|nr:hypothetical protein I858_016255 [Planococcus versutus]
MVNGSVLLEFFLLLPVNLAVGALGFVPSVLITAVNIQFFGLYGGAILTLIGEIASALLGFHLYRYGFSKANPKWLHHRFWTKFQLQSTKQVFSLVILLRLLPFVPSGFVTAGAALTLIRARSFWIASSLGKIPAVIVELATVYGIIQFVPKIVQCSFFSIVLITALYIWIKSKKIPQSIR